MHPALFRIGPFALPTYGVAIAVGFVVAVWLMARSARRQAISVNRVLDLSFWSLVVGLLGSRLLFALTHAGAFYQQCVQGDPPGLARSGARLVWDCTRLFHFWEGGLVFYGGFLAAAAFILLYTHLHRMRFLQVADLAIPCLSVGHFFGRLGCFGAGCCYGKVTAGTLGVAFPPRSLAYRELLQAGLLATGAVATPPLHPTQLYEALAELFIFGLLLWVNSRRRQVGQGLLTYLALYPPLRAFIELFRGDPGRRYVVALRTPRLNRVLGLPPEATALLSTSQLISLLVTLSALGLFAVLRARGRVLRSRPSPLPEARDRRR